MFSKMQKQQVKEIFKRKPDVDNNVELYSHDFLSNSASLENRKSYIFHGDELFLEGYPYSIELTEDDFYSGSEPSGFEFDKCRFFEAHEGTLLRVFNIDGKWYTSTNRRLNAFNSNWIYKKSTFGIDFAAAVKENIRIVSDDEIFEEEENLTLEQQKDNARKYLDEIYERNLDKDKKYMFLLKLSKEEKFVCKSVPFSFFNVGVFDKDNKLDLTEPVVLDGYNVPTPAEPKFESLDHLFYELRNVDPEYIQGFIAIQENTKHFKILNGFYKRLSELRGVTPSLRFRYLELLHEKANAQSDQEYHNCEIRIDEFCRRFDFVPIAVENQIWNIVNELHAKYYTIYINRERCDVAPKMTKMLNYIHYEYINSGYDLITSKPRIRYLVEYTNPSNLNQLIAEHEKACKRAE